MLDAVQGVYAADTVGLVLPTHLSHREAVTCLGCCVRTGGAGLAGRVRLRGAPERGFI